MMPSQALCQEDSSKVCDRFCCNNISISSMEVRCLNDLSIGVEYGSGLVESGLVGSGSGSVESGTHSLIGLRSSMWECSSNMS